MSIRTARPFPNLARYFPVRFEFDHLIRPPGHFALVDGQNPREQLHFVAEEFERDRARQECCIYEDDLAEWGIRDRPVENNEFIEVCGRDPFA
jgi:hypothetical protein